MIPLKDNIPSRSTPVVNIVLIAVCAAAFMAQLFQESGQASLIERYGMVPARVTTPDVEILIADVKRVQTPAGVALAEFEREMSPTAVPSWMTLLTCVFLHGGWMHFLGNMWILWIFGDNVEDRYGHFGYLIFFLASGFLASLAHYLVNRHSGVPTIGASGAIAGVMGAYFLLYPRARVLTVVPIFILIQILWLPAPLFLGFWFLMQFYQGTFAVVSTASGGIAWWAHIGGFAAGLLLTRQLLKSRRLGTPVAARRSGSDHAFNVRHRPGSPWH